MYRRCTKAWTDDARKHDSRKIDSKVQSMKALETEKFYREKGSITRFESDSEQRKQ